MELLGKFITGISIIYKWYSFPLFSIKRLSHRNAPYKLFAKRILKLRHPKHLFFLYCSRSPLLHYFYRIQVRSLPCPETKSLTPCSSWYWFQIRFVKIDLWTYLSYIDLSIYLITLLHGYVKVVLCISRPMPRFQSLMKLLLSDFSDSKNPVIQLLCPHASFGDDKWQNCILCETMISQSKEWGR